jgi:soluble lytic murein transglycosylase
MIPLERANRGEHALANGDFASARAEFQAVIDSSAGDEMRAAALWGLIRVSYEDEKYHNTLAFVQQFEADYPNSPYLAYVYFIAGAANEKINRHQAATEAYAKYLNLRPGLLENYVETVRGDIFAETGDYASALNAYQVALLAPSLHDGIDLEIKVATSKAAIGDYAGALADYESVFQRTNNDFVKAEMDYYSGYAHLMLKEQEAGYARYLHAVENYPLAYHSYAALVELVAAKVPVDDLSRGITDYAAQQYDVALVALNRYIAEHPEGDGTAQYYRAKTLYALDRYEDEVAAWQNFINTYPNHPYWSDAWAEKSYTQWHDLKDLEAGKQTLLDFVRVVPAHPEAAAFLMKAARLMEQKDQPQEAISLWRRLADEYPGSTLAPEALFLAGVTSYRIANYAQALTLFQKNLIFAADAEGQARAYFWIGKTQEKLGETTGAHEAWQQAQSLDPAGYYSERAREVLEGAAPFTAPDVYNPETDMDAEREEAISWLRITFELPPETDLTSLGTLQDDLRLQRGREFWELGLYNEARQEFESLRESVSDNAADSFRLANYMLDLGLYRPAIFAARQVLELAGMESHAASLHAPAYFNHIRYGRYYSDIVESVAAADGFHPLFIYSVMRQESLFEKFILSPAEARGLMQIIPATGQNIANTHGYPIEYTENDLYRPLISIKFGTWYLASNRTLMEGDLYATLAAYNGGPGNASEWKTLANGDPDLFLESVRFAETRDYIKAIYETYAIYKSVYGIQ